ncbi:hypothetical protein [Rhodophyticola porphyridii]|uniref:Uncharacterized protein n=1 Tax=Rhodophyticola porphyridii TaxID=1852017 RepID=A0A3L9Y377_9RHOB|nr:hypothetical protein [Rhodophyticola porphyridii]RMA41577.1 hypothetical protein D9R08_14870 [Rhodophyticola porphyridii]
MTAKLHINLTQGIVDVEGDIELVKSVYEDFKDRLSAEPAPANTRPPTPSKGNNEADKPAMQKRRSAPRKKAAASEGNEISMNADAPTRDKSLDTSKLQKFYDQYAPSSAPEKILIFLKFLIEEVGIESPNTDQVYTCFLDAKEKPPQAFAQAFRDTSSKKGFIDFNSAEDIVITTKGNNHFEFDLKKKGAE